MTKQIARSILFGSPAACAYLVLAPLASIRIDRRLGLSWPLPHWSSLPALILIPAGMTLALWAVWLFATQGDGTPNPISPPKSLVRNGPFRYSRNPMMLGAWLAGFGLALALRSPSLVVFNCLIVIAGYVYVRVIEEPRLRRRFGRAYREYLLTVPRWLPLPGRCHAGDSR